MALFNTIINLKTQNYIRILKKENHSITSNNKDYLTVFNEISNEQDEETTYVEIPLKFIIGDDIEMHLNQISMYVLNSFDLENKSRFSNFSATRDFLNKRFNFDIDEVQELSPFDF